MWGWGDMERIQTQGFITETAAFDLALPLCGKGMGRVQIILSTTLGHIAHTASFANIGHMLGNCGLCRHRIGIMLSHLGLFFGYVLY